MSVHVIEGKVVEAPVKFSRRGIVRFEHLTLARTDGQCVGFEMGLSSC